MLIYTRSVHYLSWLQKEITALWIADFNFLVTSKRIVRKRDVAPTQFLPIKNLPISLTNTSIRISMEVWKHLVKRKWQHSLNHIIYFKFALVESVNVIRLELMWSLCVTQMPLKITLNNCNVKKTSDVIRTINFYVWKIIILSCNIQLQHL